MTTEYHIFGYTNHLKCEFSVHVFIWFPYIFFRVSFLYISCQANNVQYYLTAENLKCFFLPAEPL